MRNITQSPLRSISVTTPNTTASSYFHGSCPTRPGTSHAKHTTRNNAVFNGVLVPS